MAERVESSFFENDALEVAPRLLGMQIVRQFSDGKHLTLDITEVEIYRGEEDRACHAAKGRTPRTEVMYREGGFVYVYLIYGMYWLLNITTGRYDHPQALLIRGTKQFEGPGRIGKVLQLDKSFYGEELATSNRLWICSSGKVTGDIVTLPRIGIDYAGPYWGQIPWRYVLKTQ